MCEDYYCTGNVAIEDDVVLIFDEGEKAFSTIDILVKNAAISPTSFISETDEIADAVVFLCSERAGYMTGSVLNMSGGLRMG